VVSNTYSSGLIKREKFYSYGASTVICACSSTLNTYVAGSETKGHLAQATAALMR